MNQEPIQALTLTFSGQISINGEALEELLRKALAAGVPLAACKLPPGQAAAPPSTRQVEPPTPPQATPQPVRRDDVPPRLAFSVREAAEMLGISHVSVRRLLQRGLLKGSSALRTKLIPKTEIERFLKQTTRE